MRPDSEDGVPVLVTFIVSLWLGFAVLAACWLVFRMMGAIAWRLTLRP